MSTKTSWSRTAAELRASATRAGRARLGCCYVEGTRVFERALRAGARVRSVLTTSEFRTSGDERTRGLFASLEHQQSEVFDAPREVLAELTGGRSIGAVVGLADLPEPARLPDLLATTPNAVFLGAVGQDDPGNAGALVRTAHALGAAAFLAAGAVDPFHPKAVRTSMGSVFRLPILQLPDLASVLTQLRAGSVQTLGSVTSGGTPLPNLELGDGPVAMLLGSEAFGLSNSHRGPLDELVTIPMPAAVDSLSINAAAAVLLYGVQTARKP
ncbi:MAG: RNA methyltransferase [bacterium]|nr:RNA methyltransferase [bacterium]